MVVVYKDIGAPELIRHLEYHLLLGVDHAVYIDNSCDNATARRDALEPYIASGVVRVFDKLVCKSMTHFANQMPTRQHRGSSAIGVAIIHGEKWMQPPRGTLVIPIDDDEYMMLYPPLKDLHE